jgi:hypothetical protein
MSDMSTAGPSISGVFDVVCSSLGRESAKVAKVFSGAACEAWLLAEMRLAIDWAEPRLLAENQWAKLESKKRDIIVIDQAASEGGAPQVKHVIEVKVLYSACPSSKLREKLKGLREQLSTSPDADESGATQRSGVVFATWDTATPGKNPLGYEQFLGEVRTAIGEVFDATEFNPGPSAFRSIVEPTWITTAGQRYQVALAATWVSQGHSAVADEHFTHEEIEEAKRRLKSDSRRYTTQQVLDYLRSLERR